MSTSQCVEPAQDARQSTVPLMPGRQEKKSSSKEKPHGGNKLGTVPVPASTLLLLLVKRARRHRLQQSLTDVTTIYLPKISRRPFRSAMASATLRRTWAVGSVGC